MSKKADLQTQVDQILQEVRIVLPGTQALLGFQFVVIFNQVFQALPKTYQYIHFASLLFTLTSTLLLIAPVAYQQLGENGKLSLSLLSFARKTLIMAMLSLLIALTGDVYIAAKAIALPSALASGTALAVFLAGITLWYIYVLTKND
jgi:hypothetical protein